MQMQTLRLEGGRKVDALAIAILILIGEGAAPPLASFAS